MVIACGLLQRMLLSFWRKNACNVKVKGCASRPAFLAVADLQQYDFIRSGTPHILLDMQYPKRETRHHVHCSLRRDSHLKFFIRTCTLKYPTVPAEGGIAPHQLVIHAQGSTRPPRRSSTGPSRCVTCTPRRCCGTSVLFSKSGRA